MLHSVATIKRLKSPPTETGKPRSSKLALSGAFSGSHVTLLDKSTNLGQNKNSHRPLLVGSKLAHNLKSFF